MWGEHIFIECKDIDKKTAEDSKITLKLMDKGFFKGTMIGEFEFDMSFVYFKDKHVFLH